MIKMKLLTFSILLSYLVMINNKNNDLNGANLGYFGSFPNNQPTNNNNYYQNTNYYNPNMFSSFQQPSFTNSSNMYNLNPNFNPLSLLLRDPFINQYLAFMAQNSQLKPQQNQISPNKMFENHINFLSKLNKTKPIHKSKIDPDQLASSTCDSSDIYCLCKFHPRYKDCVCLAYPKSVICSETYCAENPLTYECNPQRCDDEPKDDKCFCKDNMDDIKCKCKMNPVNKECFCMKFPFSHLCNDKICRFNPNSLFCKCQLKPQDKICSPKFCVKNPNHPQCECIINPMNKHCKCVNDPNSCEQNHMMRDVIEYDIRIRNLCKNSNSNSNSTSTHTNEDKDLNNTIIKSYYPNLKKQNKTVKSLNNCLSPPVEKVVNGKKESSDLKENQLKNKKKTNVDKKKAKKKSNKNCKKKKISKLKKEKKNLKVKSPEKNKNCSKESVKKEPKRKMKKHHFHLIKLY